MKFVFSLIVVLVTSLAQAQSFPLELLNPEKALTLLFQTPDSTKGSDLRHHYPGIPAGNCQSERRLSEKGEQQALIIRQALARLNLSPSNYIGSTYCRSNRALQLINPDASIESSGMLDSICFSSPEVMHKNSEYLRTRLIQADKPAVQLIMAHQCNIRFILQKELTDVCGLPGRMPPGSAAVIYGTRNSYQLAGCISMEQWRLIAEPPFD